MAWMYLTAIFYPVSILPPELRAWLNCNPAFHFVEYARQVLLYGTVPNLNANLTCCAWAFGALLIGLIVFKNSQDKFILYM
jgi:ABC-2 type transport system permease protein